jgi:hypothetical protein
MNKKTGSIEISQNEIIEKNRSLDIINWDSFFSALGLKKNENPKHNYN